MNRYVAIHTHRFGSTAYMFQSELDQPDLLKKYKCEFGPSDEFLQAIGMSPVCYDDSEDGDNMEIFELGDTEIPTLA